MTVGSPSPKPSTTHGEHRRRDRPGARGRGAGLPRLGAALPGAALDGSIGLAPARRAAASPFSSVRASSAPTSPASSRASRCREDRVFGPVERLDLPRRRRRPRSSEQRWTGYAHSVLAFSAVSILGLYLLQRVQGALFLNPTDVKGVPPALAFNTAVSFVTNTNWQNYAGESTMSHLTQMSGLAVQNFVSAAVGIAVAIALVRGITRRRSETIGNFWVDLTRAVTRILLPLSIVLALVLVARGAIQSFDGFTEARTLEGATQAIPGGPFASQEAIKELGTNGGGTLNANSAHPLSNPTPVHEPARDLRAAPDPVLARIRLRPAREGHEAGLGGARGDGDPVGGQRGPRRPPRVAGQPSDRGARRRGSQHGGQGSALRRARVGDLRRVDDRAPRRARSTARTTASRPSAAPCRSST